MNALRDHGQANRSPRELEGREAHVLGMRDIGSAVFIDQAARETLSASLTPLRS
jgi:hypothetical protein